MNVQDILMLAFGLAGLVYGLVRGVSSPLLPALSLFAVVIAANMWFAPFAHISKPMLWFAGLGAFVAADAHRRPARHILHAVGLLLIVAVVEGAVTGRRPDGAGVMNPNVYASNLLLVLPWLFQSRALWAPGVIALAITGSRGAWLGALTPIVVQQAARLRLRQHWIFIAGALAAVVFGLAALRPATVEVRLWTYVEAVELFLRRPMWGWGIGSYPQWARVELHKAHADNALLTIAAEMGLTGLIAYGVVIASIAHRALRSASPARWALLAWSVHQLADDTLFQPLTVLLVMANVALLDEE